MQLLLHGRVADTMLQAKLVSKCLRSVTISHDDSLGPGRSQVHIDEKERLAGLLFGFGGRVAAFERWALVFFVRGGCGRAARLIGVEMVMVKLVRRWHHACVAFLAG